MSEVKRFRADHRHVVETEFDDAQFVGVADFDRVTAERDALQALLTAADERADVLETALKKISARCVWPTSRLSGKCQSHPLRSAR